MTSPVTAPSWPTTALPTSARSRTRQRGPLGGLAVGRARRRASGAGWSRSAYLRFEGVQLVGQRHECRVVLRFGTVQELRRPLGDAPYGQRRRRPRRCVVPAEAESSCHAGYTAAPRSAVAARRRDRAAR